MRDYRSWQGPYLARLAPKRDQYRAQSQMQSVRRSTARTVIRPTWGESSGRGLAWQSARRPLPAANPEREREGEGSGRQARQRDEREPGGTQGGEGEETGLKWQIHS